MRSSVAHRDDPGAEAIEEIADRVTESIRGELEAIAVELLGPHRGQQLTVAQVARRLGVARSTVYAHWREWGGYKLGNGAKAPIRFDVGVLPAARVLPEARAAGRAKPLPRRSRSRRRRDLLASTPRFSAPVELG